MANRPSAERVFSERELDVRLKLANESDPARGGSPTLSDINALCTAVREMAAQLRAFKRQAARANATQDDRP